MERWRKPIRKTLSRTARRYAVNYEKSFRLKRKLFIAGQKPKKMTLQKQGMILMFLSSFSEEVEKSDTRVSNTSRSKLDKLLNNFDKNVPKKRLRRVRTWQPQWIFTQNTQLHISNILPKVPWLFYCYFSRSLRKVLQLKILSGKPHP